MILSGYKKEEYREVKQFWRTRFIKDSFLYPQTYKDFDFIHFTNGYAKDAPTIIIECNGISIGKGKTHWGAEPHESYFVLKLGNIIETKNIN